MNVLMELLENAKNKELYQWDVDRQIRFITLLNEKIDEVHFSNVYNPEALIVIPEKSDDGYFVANIPNILLQNASPIDVHFSCCNCTTCKNTLKVNPRKKPSDYVYTETETKNYDDHEERIKKLENNANNGNKNAVQYVEQELKEEEKNQARKNIGAASAENVSKLSEEIADLKENGTGTGGSGLTVEMATALDNMFKVCAYTKEDVSEEYNAFRNAFGLDVVLIPATAITLTSSALSFTALNDSRTLKATLEPTDSTDKIVWTSSNEAVAKVVNGVVTVVGEGTATITATATSGVSATCTVNVVIASNVYTVTNTLENVTNSNNATAVEEGSNYVAYLTVSEGYELTAPKITMGGVDITATAYANGTVSIASVTGNIVIEAVATEISTLIYELAQPLVCDGVNYVDTGVVVNGTDNLVSKNFTLVAEVEFDVAKTNEISNGDLSNSYVFTALDSTTIGSNFGLRISQGQPQITIGQYHAIVWGMIPASGKGTIKLGITHVSGSVGYNIYMYGIDTKKKQDPFIREYNGYNSTPYSLLLGACYDNDGNTLVSNFRGTIKQFAIHNEIWSDEAINEYLGVE